MSFQGSDPGQASTQLAPYVLSCLPKPLLGILISIGNQVTGWPVSGSYPQAHPWVLSPPTGAGKTYSMLGMDAKPGIYLQALRDLFQAIEDTRNNMDYSVSMSYLEVGPHILPASGNLQKCLCPETSHTPQSPFTPAPVSPRSIMR